ncbi:MAG: 5-(carboxyamino)imidazole ribonucleotide synthase [Bacteroidetes bacterium]|nr:5-(carboxyamino)imidazole ribonucleotide synthase [Bacteroidota bacterium]
MPLPRLGVLGGGQLSKMTASAAANFGCEVVVIEREADFPANSVDAHSIVGDWNDPVNLLKLAELVDVMTLENEFVSTEAMAVLVDRGVKIWPTPDTMRLVRDKFRQKTEFSKAGLEVARFAEASTKDAVLEFGFPCVLKRRFGGYDGKGNATIRDASELDAAWNQLDGDSGGLYVEDFCDFDRELAIIVTRGIDGKAVRYPVVETINKDHICHVTKAPADVPDHFKKEVADIAERAVAAIGGVGSFGLETFLTRDGRILVNEIAPRVHNTGHYTIEACVCSQFENHVRAVLGWPLGSTELVAPAAVMVNLLGDAAGSGAPKGMEQALAVPGAHIHIYGKTVSRPGRKMGHITALGKTVDEALSVASEAADRITFGD